MVSLKPLLYLVTEINEILVRGLTAESVWRPAGIHTCSPAAFTSVSAEEEQMQLCFTELSQHQTLNVKVCSSLIDCLPLSVVYSPSSVAVCN